MYKPFKYSLFLIIVLLGCSRRTQPTTTFYNNDTPKISFCDLPKYENQLVFVRCVYSGIDEYWGLNSENKSCKSKNVELDDYKEGSNITKRFQPLFDSVHSSYWNSYLIIEMTGKFESKNPQGYGHLGSNKSRFILKDIVNVELRKKVNG